MVSEYNRTLCFQTSQDGGGGDSTSITSGIENEIKKPGAIIKTKRNSIKRKVQNFSHESDDAVVEPLLQKDKEKKDKEKKDKDKNDISNQSAKYNIMSKTKTDANSERGGDKDKLLPEDELKKSAFCNASDDSDTALSNYSIKENSISKTSASAPIHNHMNTNVFSSHDALKDFVAPKSQILVEIDGCKQVWYSPSPLIFTTAKIHTDGKTQHMEPLQVTPVPILSTIELNVVNTGKNKSETSGPIHSSISTMYTNIPKTNTKTVEKEQKPPLITGSNTPTPQNKIVDTKILSSTDKSSLSGITPASTSKSSLASKDTKISQSTFGPDSIKDNVAENKRITIENTKDQDGYKTKMPMSQPTIFSTSVKTKTPSETTKLIHVTPTTTNTTSMKDGGVIEQAVPTSKDKTDALKYPEKKNDLNKNIKHESSSDSDKSTKDKSVTNSNNSFNSKQLQRQNIVTDKDDHISTLKSYSSIDDSKSVTKSSELSNPPVIEENILSDKANLSQVKASSVPITCNTTVSISNNAAVHKTSASISTATALTKMSVPITTTASVNKTASVTTAASLNKISAPITTTGSVNKTSATITTAASLNKMSVPIITTASVIKTSASLTTAASFNKMSAPITSTSVVNKTSTSISTAAAPNKTSVPITTTAVVNKTSATTTTAVINKTTASTTSNVAVNKPSAPIATSAAINKIPVSVTTTASANKSSAPITTQVATNKTTIPITTIKSVNKSSAPVNTAAAIYKTTSPVTIPAAVNKTSVPTITTATAIKTTTPVNTTAAVIKTFVPISTAVTANKSLISNTISSVKPSTTSSNTLPTSSNTPIVKLAIATTSTGAVPLSTEKYSDGNAVPIPGNAVQLKTSSASSNTKTQVTGTLNTKPSSTSSKLTKASTVVTPNTTSQPSTAVKSATVTTTKSATTKKMPTIENQGKSTENTTKNLTSNTKPSTAKSISTLKNSSAGTTHGISNVSFTANPTSSNSASSSQSSKIAVSNKQSESKSNDLSNGNKSLNA